MRVRATSEVLKATADEIEAYRTAAANATAKAIDALIEEYGEMPTRSELENIARVAVDSIHDMSLASSDSISVITADYLEAITNGVLSPEIIDGWRLSMAYGVIESDVYEMLESVCSGDMSIREFSSRSSEQANREVLRLHGRALDRMTRNVSKRTRWARVPTGATTCPWCLLMASQGFVYTSAADAASASHSSCDCMIVPSFMERMTAVTGYDPDDLYRQWEETGYKPNDNRKRHDKPKSK